MKRNRVEVKENADYTPSLTIVDIYYDCLEPVFGYLEFIDLINVAEANKHLKVAAEMVFVRKFMERDFEFCEPWRLLGPTIEIYVNAIRIRGWLLAVKIIRQFGCSVSKIYLKT